MVYLFFLSRLCFLELTIKRRWASMTAYRWILSRLQCQVSVDFEREERNRTYINMKVVTQTNGIAIFQK
jgi:hypothetical protein